MASDPPIDDITESSFNAGLRRFLGDDIRQIARNPQEYSDFVSKKAERAAIVAGAYRSTHYDPTTPARFYSYQLGNETVGLLRAGGPIARQSGWEARDNQDGESVSRRGDDCRDDCRAQEFCWL
ncbi:hypothetical protein XH93_08525 [Bradyrhizobium sp. CCBAU 51753]|nr:hypothetical protein XH93_08525 [Bradyrhizobium sp. CCBAU 51753]